MMVTMPKIVSHVDVFNFKPPQRLAVKQLSSLRWMYGLIFIPCVHYWYLAI